VVCVQIVSSQYKKDPNQNKKVYTSLEEALKSPEKVFNLNLSDQNIVIPKDVWDKFINLEVLNLKNDHFSEIPEEIGNLKNLRFLDLSGNDFVSLPQSLSKLKKLEELFLNDEKNLLLTTKNNNLNLPASLRVLHLENDNLEQLPSEVYALKKLERLYLNNNKFIEIPKDLRGLKNLKQLDFHDNKIPASLQDPLKINHNFGFKIIF
jgi:Leucine-rich repeat (LRR) protein